MDASESDEDHNGSNSNADDDMELMAESEGEEQQFDKSLAATHSYMGPGLVALSGRCVLEAGWRGTVSVVAHMGAVFPGETVPMFIANHNDIMMYNSIIEQDKIFGLLCPDGSGTMVSGYGVLCEVFAAGVEGEARRGALALKARATQRFRMLGKARRELPLLAFGRLRPVRVEVLPELGARPPLRRLRPQRPPLAAERAADAALTPWPRFLYDMFDYGRIRDRLCRYFRTLHLDRLPEEPVSLSFWVASNLALPPSDRLTLLAMDDALLRLHMELDFISRRSALCCAACLAAVAPRERLLAMSSEGVHGHYTNLGGFLLDVLTVAHADNVRLEGRPSQEYSWFPGYAWTIAVCANCRTHLGWRFDAVERGLRPARFFGLSRNYVQPRFDEPPESL